MGSQLQFRGRRELSRLKTYCSAWELNMNRNYIGSLVGSFSCSIVLEQHAVIAERRGFKSGCDNIDLICSDAFLTQNALLGRKKDILCYLRIYSNVKFAISRVSNFFELQLLWLRLPIITIVINETGEKIFLTVLLMTIF